MRSFTLLAVHLGLVVALAAGGGTVAPALAADLPPGLPAGLSEVGRIDWVDHKSNVVVIDDSQYVISAGTPVMTSAGKLPADKLRAGMRVGFRSVSGDQGQKLIAELWVLGTK